MAFRAYESEQANYAEAMNYCTRSLPEKHRKNAKEKLGEIIDHFGPVVDGYPSWHPIVFFQEDRSSPAMTPGPRCGYVGLDHTVYLRNGFVTCPYSDGTDVIESVEALADKEERGLWTLKAEKLKVKLYHEKATPVLVTCRWKAVPSRDGTIPLRMAAGLLLETELPAWHWAQHAENWETMRNYFLGTPCGSRSSLFVNEVTGQALKKLWNTVINTGVYGPINVAD